MFGLKPMEMLLIVLVLLLLFGARRIPEVAKGVADGIKTFKKSMKDDDPESKGKDRDKIATS
jgi:sec-independent protein translocase protein TatA